MLSWLESLIQKSGLLCFRVLLGLSVGNLPQAIENELGWTCNPEPTFAYDQLLVM